MTQLYPTVASKVPNRLLYKTVANLHPTLTKIWESAITFDDATMKALEDNLGLSTVA